MIGQRDGDGRPLATRVMLRPVGTPMPLGFAGLAVASLVVSLFDLGWIPLGEQRQVAIVLLAFAVPLQLVATVFGLLSRDAVVASGIGVQSGAWLTLGLLLVTSHPGSRSVTLGVFLFGAAAALAPAIGVAVTSKAVPALVMAGTAARFVLLGVWHTVGGVAWKHAGGYEGLVLAAFALYAAVALDLESSQHRTIAPTLRFGAGRRALSAPAAAAIGDVEHEPGVRSEL